MKGIIVRAGTLFMAAGIFAAQPANAANQPPVAKAGPDLAGTVNVAVTFNASASFDPDGTISAYWWTWGDGGSATVATPTTTHVYTAPGLRTAILWVRDNAGTWSPTFDSALVSIGTVAGSTTTTTLSSATTTTAPNQPPHANAGPDQATQTLTSLTFNGSGSTDAGGTIATYAWSFGDGTTGSGVTATHSYASAGTYTVTLTVTDNKGATNSDTAVVSVANRPPTAKAGPDQNAPPNTSVTLNGSGSSDLDGTIVSYSWAFGDGTTGSGVSVAHVYGTAGTYTATLTVTDNKGAQASDTAVVTVTNLTFTWARSIGAASSDAGYAVASDASGNVYLGGTFRGSVTVGTIGLTSAGGADWFLAKYASTGAVQWARSFGGTSDDYVESVAVDAGGNVVAAGRFAGTASFGGTALVAAGPSDIALAKYDTNGAHQWSKQFGGAYDDGAAAVATDGSGNVYLTGFFIGTITFGGGILSVPFDTDLDVFLAKFNSAGAHVWSKNFTNTGNDRGYGIAVDSGGNVAITGYFSNDINFGGGLLTSLNAMTDIFVARFTTAGVHSWSKRFGAPDGNEGGNAVAMDASGNVVVTGYAIKAVDFGGGLLSALGSADAFVAKYAATSGAHQWSRRIGSTMNDYGYGVAVDGSGNVFVAGSFESTANFGGTTVTPVGGSDAFVAKYNSAGAPQWAKGLGGTSSDVGQDVAVGAGYPVTTGYFYGTGTFDGTPLTSGGLADVFVVRLAP
ncbi:MAG: PKD domain-containing protein [Candidatus Binatia bacterium]